MTNTLRAINIALLLAILGCLIYGLAVMQDSSTKYERKIMVTKYGIDTVYASSCNVDSAEYG
jgi:type IV secretory pathway VirB2 component (pilin)